jgi:hypothetical protein
MNLARPYGRRLNRTKATVPLAVMTISAERVSIGPIALLRRVVPNVWVARQDVEAVFRATGFLTPGVGLRESTGVHFFWSPRGRRIVAELETLGYPVTPPQRPNFWRLSGWSRTPIE